MFFRIAYRSGVTSAIVYPLFGGTFGGLSAAFSLGASHKLEENAVVQDVVALHVRLSHLRNGLSVSTQISALRKALSGGFSGDQEKWFKAASEVRLFFERLGVTFAYPCIGKYPSRCRC
jgi:hypothetical protein